MAAIIAGFLIYRGTSRTRFLRALDRVEAGMTFVEVEQVMTGYVKGRGAKWRIPSAVPSSASASPDPASDPMFSGSIMYRHSDASRYDSDWGVVTFQAGRVATVEFLPD